MSERDKGRAKRLEAQNQMENKKSRRISGDLQHLAQGPLPESCVCDGERDVWGIQSWPWHAESYFPLAVARQHHLDGEKWSHRDGSRGMKTETGLTLTWYFHITPFCFKAMPLLVPQLTGGFIFFSSALMGQVKGRRAANSLSSSWWRRFSSFNVGEVMAFTCIWPWGSFTRIWPQDRRRAVGGQDQSHPAGRWHMWPDPLLDKHDVISVWASSWPPGVQTPGTIRALFSCLRSQGQEMIEWLITPIEAFNRNKRRLDTRGRKMENAEVMDPPGPSVLLKGGRSCDNGNVFCYCLHRGYELVLIVTAIKSWNIDEIRSTIACYGLLHSCCLPSVKISYVSRTGPLRYHYRSSQHSVLHAVVIKSHNKRYPTNEAADIQTTAITLELKRWFNSKFSLFLF